MAEKILMLALSPTMDVGTITRWNKHEGDVISGGDVLCEVETDKATMDYESTIEGTLLKIVANEGAKVKVGDLIAIAGEKDEDVSEIIKEKTSLQPEKVEVKTEQEISKGSERNGIPSRSVKASPLAREIARRNNIDLDIISGSGPGGRIIKEDVENAISAYHFVPKKRHPETFVTVPEMKKFPISEKRRIIAKRLSDSMFTAPHYYVTIQAVMDSIITAREFMNTDCKINVSLNAYIIKIVAEVLRRYPIMLSSWNDDSIIQFENVDIAIAVAQKEGLITPIVRNCTVKGIKAINEELKDLIPRARENKLNPEEYSGASFTISNLGSYGIRQFTAIINPPASAILAVGEIFKDMVIDKNNNELVQNVMICTLSCDHRVIDGAVSAQFAHDLKECLENPIAALY